MQWIEVVGVGSVKGKSLGRKRNLVQRIPFTGPGRDTAFWTL